MDKGFGAEGGTPGSLPNGVIWVNLFFLPDLARGLDAGVEPHEDEAPNNCTECRWRLTKRRRDQEHGSGI